MEDAARRGVKQQRLHGHAATACLVYAIGVYALEPDYDLGIGHELHVAASPSQDMILSSAGLGCKKDTYDIAVHDVRCTLDCMRRCTEPEGLLIVPSDTVTLHADSLGSRCWRYR